MWVDWVARLIGLSLKGMKTCIFVIRMGGFLWATIKYLIGFKLKGFNLGKIVNVIS